MNRLWLVSGLAGTIFVASGAVAGDFAAGSAVSATPPLPATVQTQVRTNDQGVVNTTSVEQAQAADGTTVPWRKVQRQTTKPQPGVSQTASTVVEYGPNGKPLTTTESNETVVETATGQTVTRREVIRNPRGQIIGQEMFELTTEKSADGVVTSRVVEKKADPNGNFQTLRDEQRVTRQLDGAGDVTQTEVTMFSPAEGERKLAAVETTRREIVRGATKTETVVRRGSAMGEVTGRVVTTESAGRDGTTQTETVVYGQTDYAKLTLAGRGELKPKYKVVESLVSNPDGTTTKQRQVYRYDINGDWKPVPFGWGGIRP